MFPRATNIPTSENAPASHPRDRALRLCVRAAPATRRSSSVGPYPADPLAAFAAKSRWPPRTDPVGRTQYITSSWRRRNSGSQPMLSARARFPSRGRPRDQRELPGPRASRPSSGRVPGHDRGAGRRHGLLLRGLGCPASRDRRWQSPTAHGPVQSCRPAAARAQIHESQPRHCRCHGDGTIRVP